MQNIKHLFIIMLGVISISTLNAYHNDCPPKPKSCECPPCGCEASKCPTISAYNHPARIDVCGSSDIFITGSFIYWESLEQEFYLGLLQAAPGANFRQEAINITYEYDIGFKAGI